MANVIFDFDGTLADTFPLIVDVAYRLAPHTRRLPDKDIAGLRRLPLLTAMRRLGISQWYMPLLIVFMRRRLTPRMHEVPPCDGVVPMLHALHGAGHHLFVLTSNYKENVQMFLQHHNIQHLFEGVETVYYASTASKTRVLKKFMKRNNLQPQDCYYVGNESLDMKTAQRAGIRGVATTWGGFNHEELKAVKPYAIVHAPKDLVSLLQ